MSDVTEKVRETFETVGRGVQAPPFDELAFRRKVSEAKRRGRLRVGAGIAVAASVAAVAAYAVPGLVQEDGTRSGTDQVVASDPGAEPQGRPGVVPEPLYYTAAGRLKAVTPDGTVHTLMRSEAVIGFTAEGVFALDEESHVVRIEAHSSGEGDGSFTFSRGESPVTEAVHSVALSGDGRYLGWMHDEGFDVWDLKAQQQLRSTMAPPNSYLTAVSGDDALVSEDGELVLHTNEGIVDLPTAQGGYGYIGDVAADVVTVADRDDVTRVYDVSTGVAELVTEVPGTGRLAPYGQAVVTVEDSGAAWLWTAGSPSRLTGLEGRPESAGWLDERYAVITTGGPEGSNVYVCPVVDLTCSLVVSGEEDVRLAE